VGQIGYRQSAEAFGVKTVVVSAVGWRWNVDLPESDEFREIKITRVTIVPRGEAIFCERATHVETQDEAAGEYVRIIQQDDRQSATEQTIQIDPAEWPTIRSVIDYMVENCRS